MTTLEWKTPPWWFAIWFLAFVWAAAAGRLWAASAMAFVIGLNCGVLLGRAAYQGRS